MESADTRSISCAGVTRRWELLFCARKVGQVHGWSYPCTGVVSILKVAFLCAAVFLTFGIVCSFVDISNCTVVLTYNKY